MKDLICKEVSYFIVGKCMEVHKALGPGFLEIVYKDALEYELSLANIHYEREKKFEVQYKDITLPHKFYADFVVDDSIILEIKSSNGITTEYLAQTFNYLKVSKKRLALIVNFGEYSLKYKRIVN
jgi:GxxExxY protein